MRITNLSEQINSLSPVIHSTTIDSDGFLWLGTDHGLFRFDGHDALHFQYSPNDTIGLSQEEITVVYVDIEDNLWIGTTRGGLNRYTPQTGVFKHWMHHSGDTTSISSNRISAIAAVDHDELWIGTYESSISRFDKRSETFTHLRLNDEGDISSAEPMVHTIIRSSVDSIAWIGTNRGLFRFNLSNGDKKHWYYDLKDSRGLSANLVRSIIEDDKGNLWLGTANGVNKTSGNGEFSRFAIGADNIASLNDYEIHTLSKAGNLWPGHLIVGTFSAGLWLLDTLSKSFKPLPADTDIQTRHNIRSTKTIVHVPGSTNAIVLGTVGGAYIGTRKTNQHTPFLVDTSDTTRLGANYIWPIYEKNDGTIWIGSIRGLFRFNPEDNSIRRWTHDPEDPATLSTNAVFSLYETTDNRLWIGTFGGGLNYFESKSNIVARWESEQYKQRLERIYAMLEDGCGHLLLGSESGLFRYTLQSGETSEIRISAPPSTEPIRGQITALAIDERNALWAAVYARGLFKLTSTCKDSTRVVTHWIVNEDPTDTVTINENTISDLYFSKKSESKTLWMATEGGGINRLDLSTGEFTHITEQDGLSANQILRLLEDDNGMIWASTQNALNRIDPATNSVTRFTEFGFIRETGFHVRSGYKLSSGELAFGTDYGIVSISPAAQDHENESTCNLLLTRLRIFGKPVASENFTIDGLKLPYTKGIRLDHRQFDFGIEFSLLDFLDPASHRYAYMLDGFHQDWVYIGRQNSATLTNLVAGDYTFRVKAADSRGNWNHEESTIQISILPPFWNTWWFRILVVLIAVTGLLAIHLSRIRRLNELQKVRAGIAADLHDEVASSLASIRLYSEVIKDQNTSGLEKEGQALLDRINKLSDEVANGIREIIWAVDPSHDDLHTTISYINRYAQRLMPSAGIAFSTANSEHIRDINLKPEERRAIYLILKEALTNSVKHSNAAHAWLSVEKTGRKVTFELKDDGCGIPESIPPGGYGISNMKRRAAEISAELRIVSTPQNGTKIQIEI